MDRYIMSDGAHDRWLAQAALDLFDDLPCWVRVHEGLTEDVTPRTVHLAITRRRHEPVILRQRERRARMLG